MSNIPTIEQLRKLPKLEAVNILEDIIISSIAIDAHIQQAYNLADELKVWVGQRDPDVVRAEIRVRDGGDGRLCYFKYYVNRDGTEFLAARLNSLPEAVANTAEEIVPVTWGGADATS